MAEGSTGADSGGRINVASNIENGVNTEALPFEQKVAQLKELVDNPDYEIDPDVIQTATPDNIDRLLANANAVANEKAKKILMALFSSQNLPPHQHKDHSPSE